MQRKLKLAISAMMILVVVYFSTMGSLEQRAVQYTDSALKRALITYGIARGINGIISVIQGTEVAIQPAGVGINLAPGQILDPVNDLVERFSWVVLLSTVSLGIQKFLIEISTSWLLNVTTVVLLLISVYCYALSYFRNGLVRSLYLLTVVFLFVRFAIPLIAVVNDGIYEHYLSQDYAQYTKELQEASTTVSNISQRDEPKPGTGIIDNISAMFGSVGNAVNVNAKIDEIKRFAEQSIGNMINLIIIFVLETVVFPLVFLFGGYKLLLSTLSQVKAKA